MSWSEVLPQVKVLLSIPFCVRYGVPLVICRLSHYGVRGWNEKRNTRFPNISQRAEDAPSVRESVRVQGECVADVDGIPAGHAHDVVEHVGIEVLVAGFHHGQAGEGNFVWYIAVPSEREVYTPVPGRPGQCLVPAG